MNNNENPYLNGGVPINSQDLTKDIDNTRSELMSSLAAIKRLHNLKQMGATSNVPNLTEQKQEDTSYSVAQPKPAETNYDNNVYSEPKNGIDLGELNFDNNKKEDYIPEYRVSENNSNDDFVPFNTENYVQYKNIEQNENSQPAEPVFNNGQFENYEQPAKPVNNEPTPITIENANQPTGEVVYKVDEKDRKSSPVQRQDIKQGKKIAWLAYILFFLPLLFARKNSYVRFHANEGLEINIFDALGIGLFCVGYFIKHDNNIINLVLLACVAIGLVLLILTTLTKIVMIIFSFCGKTVQTPWLWKARIIK